MKQTPKRRQRPPRCKKGWLRAGWGYTSAMGEDLYFSGGESCDMHLLCNALTYMPVHEGRSLMAELGRRGYDLATLRFEVQLRKTEKP